MSIDLKSIEGSIEKNDENEKMEIKRISNQDIAVIGISCRFGKSNNKEQFWESLVNGEDHIRPVPKNRRKFIETYFRARGIEIGENDYQEGAYLNEIDKFDNELFSISPLEANLMSPNQRVFLEVVWSAIEDAGYGGKKMQGSKTGVFLGHTTDFGIGYKRYVETLNEELAGLSMSGNLNSTIASRISYLLDLRGPSMLVDTACSSSLSAIHLACQSIRNNECKMALAGSARIDLSPVKIMEKIEDIGISASNRRARTFDDSSDGTGDGEGVGAVLLKPLYKALEDGDCIYAVIKGSAMNQDGKSVGMTAPNPEAQKAVILEAWKNAQIEPETITYIEAHGTGTKLGDPIEVSGIERAFREWTNKKQFCGIGSVKTNIGHLDCAAGMAGFIKLALSLKKGEIPPTINFNTPNKKINFENSPVYVNDRLRKWVTNGYPRRGGISAFGLSGTNCHIVLEEPPVRHIADESNHKTEEDIFILSAKNKQSLIALIRKFLFYFYKKKEYKINDICYTLASGRGHYNHRLAIAFDNLEELKLKLQDLYISDLSITDKSGIFYKEHRIVSNQQLSRKAGEITSEFQVEITTKANGIINEILSNTKRNCDEDKRNELCSLYINGADIDWECLYNKQVYEKVSLPTYSFIKQSCWVEESTNLKNKNSISEKTIKHPLFETCLSQSFDRITFLSRFETKKYWVLNEHRVAGVCVVPGTTYLEMITEYAKTNFPEKIVHLKDVLFVTPLSVDDNEVRDVQTIINNKDGLMDFTIVSKVEASGEWIKHVEGKILLDEYKEEKIDIEKIKDGCERKQLEEYSYHPNYSIEVGPRWSCLGDTYIGNNEILGCLSLKNEYIEELKSYHLHPALLDEAVNVAIRTIGEGIYLPFSYKDLEVLSDLPQNLYSYIKKNNENQKNQEFASFDVLLTNENGKLIAKAKDYKVKKVDESKMMLGTKRNNNLYYNFIWKEKETESMKENYEDNFILIIKGKGELNNKILEKINHTYTNTIEVEISNEFKIYDDNKYAINGTEESYKILFGAMKDKQIDKVIYMTTLLDENEIKTIEQFNEKENSGIYNLFYMIKAMVEYKYEKNVDILIVAQYANEVDKTEPYIEPLNASLFGLGKVVNSEYPKFKCRCIDIDDSTSVDVFDSIFNYDYEDYIVSYRNGKRFVTELDTLNLDKVETNNIEIKASELYIITGGTGGIGLEVANYISTKANVKIALINRTPFPQEENWNEILEKNEDEKLCYKIRILKQIIANGTTIMFYKGNTSCLDEMKEVFYDLQKKHGNIRGIFHCAGVAGNGFIINRSQNDFENVILPKTRGTWILNKLTQTMDLDFFIMFSSISSFVIEPGQGDYIAANSYLDSFASYGNRLGNNMITINWTAFEETGMAVDYKVSMNNGLFRPIRTKKAMDVLDYILNKKVENIIVGEINIDYMNQNNNLVTFNVSDNIKSKIGSYSAAPLTEVRKVFNVELKGKENKKEFTEMEIKIANIWGQVLGLKEINIYDSFLEIGGNSLLGVKVEIAMEEQQIPISVVDLYEFPSVIELANYIDGKIHKKVEKREEYIKEEKIDLIQPFQKILYKSCFHNAIIPIINFYTNNDLRILSCNDVFAFEYEENDEIVNARINDIFHKTLKEIMEDINITIITKTHISNKHKEISLSNEQIYKLNRVSQYIGIQEDEEKQDGKEIVNEIKMSLSKGKFVCIWVDCFYESIRKDTFNKEHLLHTLLLFGFDDSKNIFYGMEHSHKDNIVYRKQEISYEDVFNSYEGYLANYSEYSNIPSFYEFYHNDKAIVQYDYKKMYVDHVVVNKDKIKYGLNCLKLFLDKLNEIVNNKNNLIKNADAVIQVLNGIINDKQLERFNLITLFEENFYIVDKITETIDMWTSVRKIIIKFKFSDKYNTDAIKNITNLFGNILDNELDYITNLFDFLEI